MEFLLNASKEALYIIMGITGGAICALHFVSSLSKKKIAKIAQYVNIFLHILLFCELMLGEIEIDVSVAAFMASVFVYVLSGFLKYETDKRRETKNEEEEGETV